MPAHFVVGAATVAAGLIVTDPKAGFVPNELPRSWRMEDIASQVPPYAAGGRV